MLLPVHLADSTFQARSQVSCPKCVKRNGNLFCKWLKVCRTNAQHLTKAEEGFRLWRGKEESLSPHSPAQYVCLPAQPFPHPAWYFILWTACSFKGFHWSGCDICLQVSFFFFFAWDVWGRAEWYRGKLNWWQDKRNIRKFPQSVLVSWALSKVNSSHFYFLIICNDFYMGWIRESTCYTKQLTRQNSFN